jgi:hypothetical protein
MDIKLERPKGWVDRSMVVVAAPPPTPPSGVSPNLVVTEEAFGPDLLAYAAEDRLREFVRRQLGEMREKLPKAELIDRRLGVQGGGRFADVLIAWDSPQARLRQWVRFIDRGEGAVIATATCADREFDQFEGQFGPLLGSIAVPT